MPLQDINPSFNAPLRLQERAQIFNLAHESRYHDWQATYSKDRQAKHTECLDPWSVSTLHPHIWSRVVLSEHRMRGHHIISEENSMTGFAIGMTIGLGSFALAMATHQPPPAMALGSLLVSPLMGVLIGNAQRIKTVWIHAKGLKEQATLFSKEIEELPSQGKDVSVRLDQETPVETKLKVLNFHIDRVKNVLHEDIHKIPSTLTPEEKLWFEQWVQSMTQPLLDMSTGPLGLHQNRLLYDLTRNMIETLKHGHEKLFEHHGTVYLQERLQKRLGAFHSTAETPPSAETAPIDPSPVEIAPVRLHLKR